MRYEKLDRPALAEALACGAHRTELLAVLHWNISPPFAQDNPELDAQAVVLGRCIASQIAAIVPSEAAGMVDLVLASTVVSGAFSGSQDIGRRLFDTIESGCGMCPIGHMHTYMCTGWGYALRWFSRHTDARLVMICIVDVDVHNMSYHRQHQHIGKLGFAITTLLVRLADDRQVTAETGGPYAESAFKEFIRAVRIHNARHTPAVTFIPFFGPGLSEIAAKVLDGGALGLNRHELYGHCFGSDPWIGLIEWVEANPLRAPVNVTAGAVALSGYYTVCDLGVSPRTLVGTRAVGGCEAELEKAIRAAAPLHAARLAAQAGLG